MAVYNKTTNESLLGCILIEIRKIHTKKAASDLILKKIVPNEYIDNLLMLDILNNDKIKHNHNFNNNTEGVLEGVPKDFTNEQRIKKLTELLLKHCSATTASFINTLCNSG